MKTTCSHFGTYERPLTEKMLLRQEHCWMASGQYDAPSPEDMTEDEEFKW